MNSIALDLTDNRQSLGIGHLQRPPEDDITDGISLRSSALVDTVLRQTTEAYRGKGPLHWGEHI
jgi:hypothetical protein